jgi:NAD(P)-dependent dehydrogenase (short-subunit alcohol dehydrogenase family)
MPDAPPTISTDLSGNVAFVTGASSGLGYRFATTLAACGAKVAAASRRVDRLEGLADEIRAAGGSCLPIALDVTDADACVAAIEQAEGELGLVDILVNNAGIPDAQYATKMDMDLVDRVLDTNLRAPWVLSCEVARRLMAAKEPGRMVNIASTGAFSYGGHGAALYSITKSAIVRLTQTLSVEWSKFNINVNCIAPGAFRSEMMEGMLSRMGDLTRFYPRGRLGEPEELDSTLLYLVSPSSACVTGAVIIVDDGQGSK